jgi:hypothetical protein
MPRIREDPGPGAIAIHRQDRVPADANALSGLPGRLRSGWREISGQVRHGRTEECAGAIALSAVGPQGNIRRIFCGMPAGVAAARCLYEKAGEAFETETAPFKRSELYDWRPSAKRRGAATSFQAGLGHGVCVELDRLKAERAAAFSASGGRDRASARAPPIASPAARMP